MSEVVDLAAELRRAMRRKGLSQAELSRRSGLTPSHISMLLSGKRGEAIRIATAMSLSEALDMPISFFAPTCSHMRNHIEGIPEKA